MCETNEDKSYSWRVGIGSSDKRRHRHMRFYFWLHTEMSPVPTILWDTADDYPVDQDTHIVVGFDGLAMSMYRNGARVARSINQAYPFTNFLKKFSLNSSRLEEFQGGALYSEVRSPCKRLVIAPRMREFNGESRYRGSIETIQLFKHVLNHAEVTELFRNGTVARLPVIYEAFSPTNVQQRWHSTTGESLLFPFQRRICKQYIWANISFMQIMLNRRLK